MKKTKKTALLVIFLALSSIFVYGMQILIFEDPANTKFYLLQDIGFLPIQVILVTLFLNKLLNMLDNQQKMKKLNVIISAFFSEMGIEILEEMSKGTEGCDTLGSRIKETEFSKSNTKDMKNMIRNFEFKITLTPEKLKRFKAILGERRSLMLRMLENPNLMEHDSFTDMLWSVFHFADELQTRTSLDNLSQSDMNHLKTDTIRAYKALVLEWVDYMKYLHDEYPYLYSLAIRKNPIQQERENLYDNGKQ